MKKIDINLQEIKRLYLSGKTCIEIGKLNNCGETTIRSRLKSLQNNEIKEMMRRRQKNTKDEKSKCKVCGKTSFVCKTTLLCDICRVRDMLFKKSQVVYKEKDDLLFVINNKNKIYVYEKESEIIVPLKKNSRRFVVSKISSEDVSLISNHTWRLDNGGYLTCRYNKKNTLMHRFIMNAKDSDVDHINRNILDNTRKNLREVCCSENQVNKKKMVNNTSGVTGITWDKNRDKWKTSLNIYGKTYNLGRFEKFEDAVKAREKAEIKYHGEFTPLR